jgi:alcohol dehydrogenase
MGADLVVDVAEEDPVRKFRDATGGRLADVVVDVTANAPTAFGQAVRLSAVDGTIVLAGVRGKKGAPELHTDAIIWKEITVKGALGVDAPVYRKALELLAARAFPFELFSRQEVALDDASELLTSMAGKGSAPPPVHGVIVPGL